MAANTDEGAAEFRLRPSLDKKFSKEIAQETIHALLSEELKNKVFEGNEQIATLCQTLSTKIKDKMKKIDTGDSDYKLICYTIIGEQRGAGIRVAARCVWDSATDVIASVSYENVS
ncbi:hypothetical protein V9T40_007782 [Parthenolecanium corni]|uniref:Tctex1 domain-containing protein 2 n=1 Tax=Parthenolecanium corni TaxID=536013 RepID=A0AAN9TVY0_9HEMI